MPQKYVDSEGKEVETLTPEEVTEMTEKLKKLEEKDFNFSKLKSKVKSLEDSFNKKEEGVEQKEKDLQEKEKQIREELQEKIIGELAGDDEDKKMIKYHYSRLMDEAGTADEIRKKVMTAKVLADAEKPKSPPISDLNISNGSYNKPNSGVNKEKWDSEMVEFAKKFGLDEAKLKKHNVL
jgi:septal ring factor EnvC (AmiA/AmiB activator)